MFIHEPQYDSRGAGRWDMSSTRYIPMSGGSRSRIPVRDSESIKRYWGFIGVDEHMSDDMGTVHALYSYLGGKPAIPPGPSGEYVQMLIELSAKWMLGSAASEKKGGAE